MCRFPTRYLVLLKAIRPFLHVIALALILAGCASSLLQQSSEQFDRTFLLEWQGATSAAANPDGPSLLVSPILAAPGFGGSGMAYMRTPHQIEYFARHRWADAPARLLEPLLVKAAGQSGLFRNVAETASGARADLRLDSRLLHLQQVCRLDPSELQLAVRIVLVDVASARIIGSRTLSISEPVLERSPYAGVEAANRAVDRLLSDLQAFLATHVGVSRP